MASPSARDHWQRPNSPWHPERDGWRVTSDRADSSGLGGGLRIDRKKNPRD
ncbi:MAG: hypothetical protein ACLQGP_39205 [Isosphaeraceae bacterium]